MKKRLCLGVALAIAFVACASLNVFATEAGKGQTNCIGDPTGMTNCGTVTEGEDEVSKTPIEVDKSILEFGRITEAGRRYSQTLTIRNNTNEKMTIRVEAINYESNALSDEQKAITDWIAFGGGKRKFELKENGGAVQLNVRLMVPAEVKGGTYYAKIKVYNNKEEETQYVTVRADIALEGYKYGGEIVSQGVGFFNMDEKVSAHARVKNSGTAGFTTQYSVRYKNAFGLSEWKQIVEDEREVLPGAEEVFEANKDVTPVVGYGIFTVEQKISYINSENRQIEAILSHAVINLPWWGIAVAGVLIVLIIVIVIVVKVRRKKAEDAEKAEKKAKKSKKKPVVIEVKEDE